jgi:hypothetical protein
MHRGRFFLSAALALMTVQARAAVVDVLVLDFSKAEDQAKMTLNGTDTSIAPIWENGRLTLTNDGSQGNSAFITTPVPAMSDYLATFQMEVAEHPDDAGGAGNPPADAVIFLAQTGGPDKVGGGGGGAGYTQANGQRGEQHRPDAADYFGYNYGIDFNTWGDNGLPDAAQTIGLDIRQNRTQLGEQPYVHVGKGLITYAVRVTPDQVIVTATGGTDNLQNKEILNVRLGGFFNAPAPLYFGWTAGTGGARQITTVANLRIQTGLEPVAVTPPPTAGQ